LNTGVWKEEDIALFRKLIAPGDVVFDVGANIGHHSVVFSKQVGAGGAVYSFEPQQYVYNVLCANLMLNDCRNVSPQRLALGERPDTLPMFPVSYDREDNFAAKGISTLHPQATAEWVRVETVDRFIEREGIRRIDFMKIDAQTFELFVLRGAQKTLEVHRPSLFVEVSPDWLKRENDCDYKDIYRLLDAAGYAVFDEELRPAGIREPDPARGIFEWDIIALPKECATAVRLGAAAHFVVEEKLAAS
jgi:FkbM family methyltransferase